MKKGLVIKALIVLLIAAVAIFWSIDYLFLSGRTAQKSKAAGESIDIVYDPADSDAAAGSDATVMVKIKPEMNLSLRGYTLRLKFNKDILKAKYIDYKVGVPSPEFGDTSGTLASINENGVIDIQGEVQNATGLVINANSTVDLVRLVFTATTAAGTTVTGSNAVFYSTAADGVITPYTVTPVPSFKVNGGTAPAACTSFSDDFSAANLNANRWTLTTNNNGTADIVNDALKLNLPASDSATLVNVVADQVKGNFTAEVLFKSINTVGNKNMGEQVLRFRDSNDNKGFSIARNSSDSGKLITSYNNTTDGSWLSETKDIGISNSSPLKVKIERSGGNAKMYYDLMDGSGYRLAKSVNSIFADPGKISLGLVNKAPQFPETNGIFDNFNLDCLGAQVTPTLTPTVTVTPGGPTLTPTPTGVPGTPTPTPVGGIDANVKFKLKFQGIAKKPKDALNKMRVRLRLYDENTEKYADADVDNFTANDNGIWSGEATFTGVLPAHRYTLLVKGAYHIQKKVCVEKPDETSPGTYHCIKGNISLTANNEIDLSGILLMTGDLPVQDGVVNAYDTSLIRNNLGKSDDAAVAKADVNRDGIVDTQDWSLVIASLSIRSDEL